MFDRLRFRAWAVLLLMLAACDHSVEIPDPFAGLDPPVEQDRSGDTRGGHGGDPTGDGHTTSVGAEPRSTDAPQTGSRPVASNPTDVPPTGSPASAVPGSGSVGEGPPGGSSAAGGTGEAPGPSGSSDAAGGDTRGSAPSDSDTQLGSGSGGSHGAPSSGPGTTGETVVVGHPREVRGVWVATAWGINFPSRSGLSAAQLRREIETMVDAVADAGLNAIYFQVRPEGDAFYRSSHEPWSRFLTGSQGGDPGMDPLQVLLERAHARGIEVHAWLNPYRARVSPGTMLHPDHMAARYPQFAYVYGTATWMDPGAAPVRARLLAVVEELVERYAIDGIHLDDYFYPYPIAGTPFPDDATYSAYLAAGGPLELADWRRENVNLMIGEVSALVRRLDPDTQFGVSPFGIYRPEHPPGIRGLDAYASLYADPLRWLAEGWLDYVAPQLYWPTTRTAQAFEPLLRWWGENTSTAHLVVGHYLSKLGSEPEWSLDEFREQLRLVRDTASAGAAGSIWYQVAPLLENRSGVADVFRDVFYPEPALGPAMLRAPTGAAWPPLVEPEEEGLFRLSHRAPGPVRATTVYRWDEADGWRLVDIVDPEQAAFAFDVGRWALATVLRDGRESEGVVVEGRSAD